MFIRHTETAEEVDEQTFFTDPRTGSTSSPPPWSEMLRIQRARYPADSWNIYGAQRSDGDNFGDDSQRAAALLEKRSSRWCSTSPISRWRPPLP
ncbi:MAG: DUF444 family protein [Acetobacteraceae bacterium]